MIACQIVFCLACQLSNYFILIAHFCSIVLFISCDPQDFLTQLFKKSLTFDHIFSCGYYALDNSNQNLIAAMLKIR